MQELSQTSLNGRHDQDEHVDEPRPYVLEVVESPQRILYNSLPPLWTLQLHYQSDQTNLNLYV